VSDLTEQFKTAFRAHPAGVAVIATRDAEGPVGLTASSVSSVAVDPPALVFSVTSERGSAGRVLAAEAFTVNLLAVPDVALARRFAVSGADRFGADEDWRDLDGLPWLGTATTSLRCRPSMTLRVGTSTVVVAEVLETLGQPGGDPLVYHDRAFYKLSDDSLV
jgi:flavin reductase (DIM6/NTAB) family NADH-FMN oxidoreductase RutF